VKYCVMCAAPIPQDQGSNSCSMCYGDIEHGKDGYYRQQLEREYQQQLEEASNQRQEF
jgi:hypothetical protein